LPAPQAETALGCSQLKQLGPGPQFPGSVSDAQVVVLAVAHWWVPTAQRQVEPEQARPLLQRAPQHCSPNAPQGSQVPSEQLVPAAEQESPAQHG
jgi:hypothetical protein